MPPRKSAEAFRTISEAAALLDLPQHVLRHWEDTFGAIRPMRRAGGRRLYRPVDLELIAGVRTLLHGERYTTKGVQKIFRDRGAGFVQHIGACILSGEPAAQVINRAFAEAEGPSSSPPPAAGVAADAALSGVLTALKALRTDLQSLRRDLSRRDDG